MRTHSILRVRPPRGRRTVVASVACVVVLPAVLLLSGCGQNFRADDGIAPAPHASTEGSAVVTPAPATDIPSEPPIGPGYAPPRAAGPTQTAVPNVPGTN